MFHTLIFSKMKTAVKTDDQTIKELEAELAKEKEQYKKNLLEYKNGLLKNIATSKESLRLLGIISDKLKTTHDALINLQEDLSKEEIAVLKNKGGAPV